MQENYFQLINVWILAFWASSNFYFAFRFYCIVYLIINTLINFSIDLSCGIRVILQWTKINFFVSDPSKIDQIKIFWSNSLNSRQLKAVECNFNQITLHYTACCCYWSKNQIAPQLFCCKTTFFQFVHSILSFTSALFLLLRAIKRNFKVRRWWN